VDKGGKLVMQQPLVMDDTSLTKTRDFRWAANRDEKRHQATDHKMESCAATEAAGSRTYVPGSIKSIAGRV